MEIKAMATVASIRGIRNYVLDHLLHALRRTPAHDEPFSHFYVEDVFPDDIYAEMMDHLPDPSTYQPLSVENYHNAEGVSTRDVIALDDEHLRDLPERQRELWDGIAAAMVAPELKTLVFQKLATDLSARFGVPRQQVPKITSFCKPSLFRDLDGYEIAPHPDGRTKIVTMQLYLPRDRTQLELGTALYKRRFKSLSGICSWHGRFEKVKQFIFQPNSGYAFAVSNSWNKKSWHGRESLPEGCGVRNTLLNIYFARDDRNY
jgi:hypothetical protein